MSNVMMQQNIDHNRSLIESFIAAKGVTKCPPSTSSGGIHFCEVISIEYVPYGRKKRYRIIVHALKGDEKKRVRLLAKQEHLKSLKVGKTCSFYLFVSSGAYKDLSDYAIVSMPDIASQPAQKIKTISMA